MKTTLFFFHILLILTLAVQAAGAQELKEGRYPDGKIRYKGYFQDGRPVGEITHYYPDGKVKAVMNHQGVKADAVLYSGDGEYKTSGQYISRKKNGLWEYRKGEQLLLSEEYTDDRLNGTATRYYSTGEVAEIKHWKAGKLSGIWKLFYENGRLRMEVMFADGHLEGKMKAYDFDGRMTAEGTYRNDLKEGVWHFYDPEGKSERSVVYHRGIPENRDEEEAEESRQVDEWANSGKKIPDPALFIDDPENYMKLSNMLSH